MQGSNVPVFIIITTSHDISTSTLRGHMPEWLIKREKERTQEVRYKPKMRRKKEIRRSSVTFWTGSQKSVCILKTLHLFAGSDDVEEIVSLCLSDINAVIELFCLCFCK